MSSEPTEPQGSRPPALADPLSQGRSRFARTVLFPNVYVWYVFLASLDALLTFLILSEFFSDIDVYAPPRGFELNPLAGWIYRVAGMPGMVIFKFVLVILVVYICEIVGRRRKETARQLAYWAVALSAIPVIVALVQMAVDVYSWVLS